jgi:hypothetical protein
MKESGRARVEQADLGVGQRDGLGDRERLGNRGSG